MTLGLVDAGLDDGDAHCDYYEDGDDDDGIDLALESALTSASA